jgi:Fe-S cluster assembly iron-binding protein IscA
VVNEFSEKQPKVIFTMGKGGVGKTTIASAIAVGLVEKGKMVITDQAKLALQDILKENGKEGIRLYSAGEGCCGPQLGLSLEDPQTTDRVEKMNGIQVAIDEQVSSIIEGITLDGEETGEGIHFVLLGLNQSC